MSAPLSSLGQAAGFSAWQELEEVLAELGALARKRPQPHEFYRQALEHAVRALSAVGGAVWLRTENGQLKTISQLNWRPAELVADVRQRHAHEAVLADAADKGRIITIAPSAASPAEVEGNPTDSVLVIAPVQSPATDPSHLRTTLAIIEILARPDASPSVYRGYEQFLSAVCELAADYHAFHELDELRANAAYREQLLRLSRVVHEQLDLRATAYTLANDGRQVIGCDRLSVLHAPKSGRARLLATSGAQRVERRSTAARHLETLAARVGRTGEPAEYADGQSDALPQIADVLEQHAEASHARRIVVVPVRGQSDQAAISTEVHESQRDRVTPRGEFVLIAEQFDALGGDLQRERLVEVAEVAATALANASEVDRLPLVWLLRPIGALKRSLLARWPRTAIIAAAVTAAIAALVFVRADFNIEATGTLQPVARRAAFAPRNGLVEALLVKHGDDVTAGQPLLKLRDPALDLEIKRVHGELETAQRQIEAVRAAKTGRAIRDANPVDTYRLSAEERELDQRLTNLRRELDLLNEDAKQLVVTSPLAGRVLTWDLSGRLQGRPVKRGEELVTVADFSGTWQLELDVPDDRIGYILAARQESGPELAAKFRLSSDQGESPPMAGRVAEISRTADLDASPGARPTPTVRVNIAFDKEQLAGPNRDELQPGVSARAQIACGKEPLGYVWFHDLWDAALGWLRF